jgi:hypothetical protein
MLTPSRRRVCTLLVAAVAAPAPPSAIADGAKTAREQYLKAAKALTRLVNTPPEGLSKEEVPAYEELRDIVLGLAATLKESADKVGAGDEELMSRVQEQIAATNERLARFAKTVSSSLQKAAETAQAITNNLK